MSRVRLIGVKMLGSIGWQEILLILLIVLLLFGSKRIPEVARSIGKGIKEFRDGMKDLTKDTEEKSEEKSNGKDTEH
jgi:sec-independent protein translocase protein TatA